MVRLKGLGLTLYLLFN